MRTLEFENKHELENNLAEQIIKDLTSAIEEKGRAYMLVSGGSTPIELFRKLSLYDIAWDKIEIGLVDERFVPTNDDASNEKLVYENLLVNYAGKANFTGMIYFTNDLFKNLEKVEEAYYKFSKNLTVSILGMGGDGHTASLFPENKTSIDSLTDIDKGTVLNTLSPSVPRRRVSCGKDLLLSSEKLYLMIVGEQKLAVLNQAKTLDLPIAYFQSKSDTYYALK